MSGLAFSSKGPGPGPAPVTSWFGSAVPDRGYTMAACGYFHHADNSIYYTADNVSSTLIKNWVPFDPAFVGGTAGATITLGAAVTAPDGTSTANHLVETATTSFHAMEAVFPNGGLRAYRRFAVIASAAERTRMFMALAAAPGLGSTETGCRTIFDLAGGQIGVANTQYGSDTTWVAVSASIKKLGLYFGNTWYLCIMDVLASIDTLTKWPGCFIGPDAGSGTGAANISYLGDVTKGINVWKTNVLHPRAWRMNSTVFFDDFPNLNSIDVNNTSAPGFNWYPTGNWNIFHHPGNVHDMLEPTPSSCFSVNNSILKVDIESVEGSNPNRQHFWMATIWNNGGQAAGRTFQPPILIDIRWAVDTSQLVAANGAAVGSYSTALMVENPFGTYPSGTNTLTYAETDTPEILTSAGGTNGIFALWGDATVSVPSPGTLEEISAHFAPGQPVWNAFVSYNIGGVVGWSGQLYSSLINSNVGHQPDLTVGTDWQVFTPTVPNPTSAANTFIIDWSQQNTVSTLWINDNSMYDVFDTGEMIAFTNGLLGVQTASAVAPLLYYGLGQRTRIFLEGNPDTLFTNPQDKHQLFTWLDSFYNVNTFFDFVRWTQ